MKTIVKDPDAEILAEIVEDVILRAFGMDPALVTVSVTDGVVILQGQPENANLGHDLVDEIRHVRGVVAVRDEFDYPPAERTFIPGLYF